MRSLLDAVSYLREYDKLANIGEIARRYFAMNAFDGVLTIIGVLMGNFMAGVQEPRIVVSTGLATCVAMGVSGLWGAYLTEAAERKRDPQCLCSGGLDAELVAPARVTGIGILREALEGAGQFLVTLGIFDEVHAGLPGIMGLAPRLGTGRPAIDVTEGTAARGLDDVGMAEIVEEAR